MQREDENENDGLGGTAVIVNAQLQPLLHY
jgi:hypothetical protein